MKPRAPALIRIGRNVRDIDRARRFYCDALGFIAIEVHDAATPAWTRLANVGVPRAHGARLRLGDQEIELTAFEAQGADYPADCSAADLVFQHCAIVVDDMAAAHARLMRHGGATAISRGGPQQLPASSGGVTAFKFRDPDGHPLELIEFPAGSANVQWQQRGEGPAIGIDHSAISVADADRSIAFYQMLGLTLASRQTNRGPEQRRLDGLDDVVVDVVALNPVQATPHLELLAYRTSKGQTTPTMQLRDIAADRLEFDVRDLPSLLDDVAASSGCIVAETANIRDAVARVAVMRDPDGHWLVLSENDATQG